MLLADGDGTGIFYKLDSNIFVYETSHLNTQMQAATYEAKEMLSQIQFSLIESPKNDWHADSCRNGLGFKRTTAGAFILNLLYSYP